MTNDYVVIAQIAYDSQDASEELSAIMELIEPNKEIDEEEFNVRFAHLYSHLNAAWNVRNLSSDDLESAVEKQLDLWKEFPTDLKPL
jgi:hypothetical protein